MSRSNALFNMVHPVISVWLTILSIVQVLFLAFFWPSARLGWVGGGEEELLGRGKMLMFTATRANSTITWQAQDPNADLISVSGDHLIVNKDGFYFLSLQVALNMCPNARETVKLWRGDAVLLEGRIDPNTCSTGLLARVDTLSATLPLVVTLDPPNINVKESHLDVIFMRRP